MKRFVVAVVLGAAAGLVAGLASGSSHRAVTTLSVSKGQSLLAAGTVAEFARSKVVADNIGVGGVHARVIGETALVELSYSASSSVRATAVVQQAAAALQALAPARFPGVRVQVVDPAHPAGGGRRIGRDVLFGALLGLLVAGLTLVRLPPQREPQPVAAPAPEPVSDTVPVSDTPEPPPPPEPAPDPLAGYRALLAEHGHEFGPDRVAEWEAYLSAFAAQTVDGRVPPGLEGMLSDVFEPLLRRSRS